MMKRMGNSEDIGMLPYYFAYGIRNSFGMDFDPVTGHIWDTENGRNDDDEINLVLPGFNSGWPDIQGPASRPENDDADVEDDLVDFDGRGEYRDPEFTWNITVGPTAIKFYNSTQLGVEYQNDIFVGDINNGRIYHFDLNEDRTGLMLDDGELEDKVGDNEDELSSGGVVFGTGFRAISDIEVGPDGNLYALDVSRWKDNEDSSRGTAITKDEGTRYKMAIGDIIGADSLYIWTLS